MLLSTSKRGDQAYGNKKIYPKECSKSGAKAKMARCSVKRKLYGLVNIRLFDISVYGQQHQLQNSFHAHLCRNVCSINYQHDQSSGDKQIEII